MAWQQVYGRDRGGGIELELSHERRQRLEISFVLTRILPERSLHRYHKTEIRVQNKNLNKFFSL